MPPSLRLLSYLPSLSRNIPTSTARHTVTRKLERPAGLHQAEPKRTINRKALEEFVALGQALLQVSGEPEALPPHPEVAHYTKVLDDLEHTKAGPAPDPDAVDRFVTETRQMMLEEKLAEAEQAAWEGRMDINAVLDSVPVRVDARMRPVAS